MRLAPELLSVPVPGVQGADGIFFCGPLRVEAVYPEYPEKEIRRLFSGVLFGRTAGRISLTSTAETTAASNRRAGREGEVCMGSSGTFPPDSRRKNTAGAPYGRSGLAAPARSTAGRGADGTPQHGGLLRDGCGTCGAFSLKTGILRRFQSPGLKRKAWQKSRIRTAGGSLYRGACFGAVAPFFSGKRNFPCVRFCDSTGRNNMRKDS